MVVEGSVVVEPEVSDAVVGEVVDSPPAVPDVDDCGTDDVVVVTRSTSVPVQAATTIRNASRTTRRIDQAYRPGEVVEIKQTPGTATASE